MRYANHEHGHGLSVYVGIENTFFCPAGIQFLVGIYVRE